MSATLGNMGCHLDQGGSDSYSYTKVIDKVMNFFWKIQAQPKKNGFGHTRLPFDQK